MGKKNHSFCSQTGVLTSRYFHICLNNKQNLLLNFVIPILTILIVCSVACDKMFSEKPSVNHSINNGYPVLTWESVSQESKSKLSVYTSGVGKVDSKKCLYFIFSENNNYDISNPKVVLKSNDGEELKTFSGDDINIVTMKNKDTKGTYSLYVETDLLESNVTYTASLFTDTDSHNNLENNVKFNVPLKMENVTKKVKNAKEGYKNSSKLSKDFSIDKFVMNTDNQQKIATIPNSKMVVDNTEYILINDSETFAYIFSDKKDSKINWNEQNYYLSCDIDLNKYSDLVPLGKNSGYKGIFDGNGHKVSNFTTKESGLINKLSGTVKNLGVVNGKVKTTNKNAGAIAGTLDSKASVFNSFVKNCTVESSQFSGGIVGSMASKNKYSEIYGCYTMNCKVKSDKYVGGVVGNTNNGKVKSCYAISELDGDKDYTGEITGYICNDGTLDNCYYLNNSGLSEYGEKSETDNTTIKSTYALSTEQIKNASEKIKYTVNDNDDVFYFKTDGQLDEFSHTQTGLFMLVCVAIFVGICNSIQEVCKERNILKREYMTNLNLGSYVLSKLIIQALLCALQMILVLGIFAIFVSGKQLSSSGVIFGSIWVEYFITMFLLCFASDVLALFISSIVKNSSTANIFIPIVLIVQIVFSGVLFDLGKTFDKIAYLMFSKWGIAGLAITSHLNNARAKFLLDNPNFELQLGPNMSSVHSIFSSEVSNLLCVWGVLLLFVIVLSVLSVLFLTRIKKDKR